MFKFNFSQVLDYPLDEEESGSESHDGIRIDQDEPQEPTIRDVCVQVTLEELVSGFLSPCADIDRYMHPAAKNTVAYYHIYTAYRRELEHQYPTTRFVRCQISNHL